MGAGKDHDFGEITENWRNTQQVKKVVYPPKDKDRLENDMNDLALLELEHSFRLGAETRISVACLAKIEANAKEFNSFLAAGYGKEAKEAGPKLLKTELELANPTQNLIFVKSTKQRPDLCYGIHKFFFYQTFRLESNF